MKKELLKNNWYPKMIRIREDYVNLCAYLEFVALSTKKDKHIYFNDLVNFSINYINEHGFNYKIDEYKPRRKPKQFMLDENTLKFFHETYNKYTDIFKELYKRDLLVCEYMELLLYIFAKKELQSNFSDSFNINWGIKELN